MEKFGKSENVNKALAQPKENIASLPRYDVWRQDGHFKFKQHGITTHGINPVPEFGNFGGLLVDFGWDSNAVLW